MALRKSWNISTIISSETMSIINRHVLTFAMYSRILKGSSKLLVDDNCFIDTMNNWNIICKWKPQHFFNSSTEDLINTRKD